MITQSKSVDSKGLTLEKKKNKKQGEINSSRTSAEKKKKNQQKNSSQMKFKSPPPPPPVCTPTEEDRISALLMKELQEASASSKVGVSQTMFDVRVRSDKKQFVWLGKQENVKQK